MIPIYRPCVKYIVPLDRHNASRYAQVGRQRAWPVLKTNGNRAQGRQRRSEAKGAGNMEGTKKAQEAFTQSCGKAVETLGGWADANQRGLRELAGLSAGPGQGGGGGLRGGAPSQGDGRH